MFAQLVEWLGLTLGILLGAFLVMGVLIWIGIVDPYGDDE